MFRSHLQAFQSQFNPLLAEFLDRQTSNLPGGSDLSQQLVAQVKDLTLRGGKRLRPALLYCTYIGITDLNPQLALQAGLACELMESSLLIHDDIMDQDQLRRGGPTVHQALAEQTESQQLGGSLAILAGNLCAFWGLNALMDLDTQDHTKQSLIKLYSNIMLDECLGQSLDLELSHANDWPDEQTILQMYEYKTARYTTQFPAQLGLTLAQAPRQYQTAFDQIGLDLGLAFQIQDDLIGVFGNSEQTGKSTSSDLESGKKTLLLNKALKLAPPKDKEEMLHILNQKPIKQTQADQMRSLLEASGARTYCHNLAQNLLTKAQEKIIELDLRKEGKAFLLGLSDYLLNRKS
ncbi:MAG TPA: polyprenyl synthetase family protein [Candidatus Wirthbacteria bacterium]|nr:polyprenyl synthetase family protein [Candidatus Wirthbacteria bacterium]